MRATRSMRATRTKSRPKRMWFGPFVRGADAAGGLDASVFGDRVLLGGV